MVINQHVLMLVIREIKWQVTKTLNFEFYLIFSLEILTFLMMYLII